MQSCFWTNITTGKDNKTHDVARVAVAVGVVLFPAIVVWGIVMLTIAYVDQRTFDLQAAVNAIGTIYTGFGVFLFTGAGSILLKDKTEPSPTVTPTANSPEQQASST